jgi:hypothetical protein
MALLPLKPGDLADTKRRRDGGWKIPPHRQECRLLNADGSALMAPSPISLRQRNLNESKHTSRAHKNQKPSNFEFVNENPAYRWLRYLKSAKLPAHSTPVSLQAGVHRCQWLESLGLHTCSRSSAAADQQGRAVLFSVSWVRYSSKVAAPYF